MVRTFLKQEMVVLATGGNSITAWFQNQQVANVHIIVAGNPGPLPQYNPRNDSVVVLYFSII